MEIQLRAIYARESSVTEPRDVHRLMDIIVRGEGVDNLDGILIMSNMWLTYIDHVELTPST